MAQIKVFGLRSHLDPIKGQLSEIIHACVVDALSLPQEKRFHRFFSLDAGDFIYPSDRSARYTIVEIALFEGRSIETKKRLLRLLFQRLFDQLGLLPNDVELSLLETPRCNWGIRGLPGDELGLDYAVQV